MKQFIITAILVCMATGAIAQPGQRATKENNVEISDFISDLSKTQKSKIDLVTKRTAKIVENYRQQLEAVRDSIRSYMDTPDDHSSILFPLYEREGRLQAEISKEYYRSKVAIDKLLTPEQYRVLKDKMAKKRQMRNKAPLPAKNSPSKQPKN